MRRKISWIWPSACLEDTRNLRLYNLGEGKGVLTMGKVNWARVLLIALITFVVALAASCTILGYLYP
jgi:hypothetical protein